ncbi:MAG TPA: FecR domain-containing protein [Clostridia bacterium]|nr:FecR domain-containing protein [Clostridia bacterium]
MAVQAPQAPVNTQVPPPVKPGRSCFGCGCGGCLISIVLVVLLVAGGGYYFFVVQAQAAVNSPAALVIITTPVDVDTSNGAGFHPARPGQALTVGNSVRTDAGGHAAIQFPDGSYMRMAPATTVTLTAVQLSPAGTLQSASVLQKVGRTFTNVQHLVSGATFKVGGHSVSAQVRGTQFEVLVRGDNTNLIKVFDGTVKVAGTTTASVTAGQQIDADANGRLSGQGPIKPEIQDPYALAAQCARAVTAGTTAGTVQTSTGDNLATGQTADVTYNSSGGTVSVALCYPGNVITVTVIDPIGVSHTSRQGSSPVQLNVGGQPGRYRAVIKAVSAPGGEAYAISFATNSGCVAGNVDTGSSVRETISTAQLSPALQQAGVTLQVQGTSSNSARLFYYSDLGGIPVSWTVVFFAASPNLGIDLTQVTVKGINLTTQIASRLSSAIGQSTSFPTDYTVDRVYSCTGPGGGIMVIEGHR